MKIKKILNIGTSLILVILLTLTLVPADLAVVCAEPDGSGSEVGQPIDDQGHIGGYIPEETHVHKVKDGRKKAYKTAEHEPKYRSDKDKKNWAVHVPVKNQGNAGLCWAVSVTTAAEYSFAKEEYERTGAVAEFHELAPAHLGYFTYNRVNDPLFNTAGDRNIVESSAPWYNLGGNTRWAMLHMATWSGLARESVAPYNRYAQTPPYPNQLAYTDELVLENAVETTLTTDTDSINTIKGLIEDYGAVCCSLRMDTSKYFNAETAAFYDYDPQPSENHALTIVGWDDDYPRTNFRYTDETSTDYDPDKAPQHDGAWVVQNSWGDNSIWEDGDNGFFYVSYESHEFAGEGNRVYAFDMMSADTYDYNFQYDGTCDCGDATDPNNEDFETVQGTSAANVYTNTTGAPITLGAVGYGTFNEGRRDYTIDVYTGLTDPADPTSGFHANTTQATSQTMGPKTAHLSEPVSVAAGETFSIVFSFNSEGASAFSVEKDRDNGTFDDNYIIFDVQVDEGQSFFLPASSDKWEDMYDYKACFRIKGFASSTDAPQYTVSFDPSGGQGEIDSDVITGGETYTLPDCTFTKADRAFHAWSVDGVYKQPGESITVSANTSVKAVWQYVEAEPREKDESVDASETEVIGRLSVRDTRTGATHSGEWRFSGLPVEEDSPVNHVVEEWIGDLKEIMKQNAQIHAGGSAVRIAKESVSDPVKTAEWDHTTAGSDVYWEEDEAGDIYQVSTTTGDYGKKYQIVVTMNAEYTSPAPPKRANTLTVSGKTVKIRRAKLRWKAVKVKRSKILKVSRNQGAVTYQLAGVKKAKYKKNFKINASTGKLTVKKRLRRGTYKVKVRVTAAGNSDYEPATKTVTCKVRVR